MDIEVERAARAAAKKNKMPEANLLAVVEVESGGKMFSFVGGVLRPIVLFEPHIFYRRLKGAERDAAVKAGLAYKTWRTKPYPRTQTERWDQLNRAQKINKQAAIESASYGAGQVMGFHWEALGFDSPADFLETVSDGAAGQIEVMVRFIIANHLDDELRDGRWAAFARGYNGSGYAKNKYDIKLAAAALRWGGDVGALADGMLRMGARGARVRELQTLLVRAGQVVKVDGDFGPATKTALIAFQTSQSIEADGIYGPETEGALSQYRTTQGEQPGKQAFIEVAEVKQGAGTVGVAVTIETGKQAVNQAIDKLGSLGVDLPIVEYATTALTVISAVLVVAGVVWAVRGYLESKKTVEV